MKTIVSALIWSLAIFSCASAQVAAPSLDPGDFAVTTTLNPAVLQWRSKSILAVGKMEGSDEIFDRNGRPVFRADWEGSYLFIRHVDENFAVGAKYFSGSAETNTPTGERETQKGFGLATRIVEFLTAGVGASKTNRPSTPVETRGPVFGISLRFFEVWYFGYSTRLEVRRSDTNEIARNNRFFGVGYLTQAESFKLHAEIWRAEMPAYLFVSGIAFGKEDITTGIVELNFNGFQLGLRVARIVGFDQSIQSRGREEDRFAIQAGWVPNAGIAATVRFETGDREETPSGQSRERDRIYVTLAYIF